VALAAGSADDDAVRATVAVIALAVLAACGGGAGEDTGGVVPSGDTAGGDEVMLEQAVAAAAAAVALPAGGDLPTRLVASLGRPDAFVVAFEEAPGGGFQRRETWSYLELETAIELVDGQLLGVEPLDPLTGAVIAPTWFDPMAFRPETTVDDVRAMLVDPAALVSTEAPPELGAATLTVYAGDQLLVAFDESGLVYVETVPLGVEGEP
jgi:hypothetical protein